MIGRVTQMMTSQQTISELTQSLDSLDNSQEEISTGLSINQPSDNPYGASQAVTLNGDLSSLTNYTSIVNNATAWTSATDTSLTSIDNLVQRVQELTVAGANGTNSAADLTDSADEVNQLIASVKQEANTQYSGQYIFSGTLTSAAPYASATGDQYQGDSGAVTQTIGPGPSSNVQVNTNLSQLLGGGQSANSNAGDGKLLNVLENVAADMTSGNTTSLGTTDLAGLQTNLNALQGLQAGVGATEDQLQLATSRIANLQISDTAALSSVQDVNMASAMTNYSNEQASYTAALKAGADIVQESLLNFLN